MVIPPRGCLPWSERLPLIRVAEDMLVAAHRDSCWVSLWWGESLLTGWQLYGGSVHELDPLTFFLPELAGLVVSEPSSYG